MIELKITKQDRDSEYPILRKVESEGIKYMVRKAAENEYHVLSTKYKTRYYSQYLGTFRSLEDANNFIDRGISRRKLANDGIRAWLERKRKKGIV
jgi:hypothetical protein